MTEQKPSVYSDYWLIKKLRQNEVPPFKKSHYWPSEGFCHIENLVYQSLKDSSRLLDFGAGDLTTRKKFEQAGFQGVYQTLDVGQHHNYDYGSLQEVKGPFDGILCLDVIEHLSIESGLQLLRDLTSLLRPGGTLVVQTPNGRCVRNPLAWDMTHIHLYNGPDLWAYLSHQQLKVEGHRVVFWPSKPGFVQKLSALPSHWTISRLLGADYADNLTLIARKPNRDSEASSP